MCGVLALSGAAALTALRYLDLASTAGDFASRAVGRPVGIGHLRVQFGASIFVELNDLTLDNAPRGSQPWMLKVARLDAEISPWSLALWALLRRAPVIRHLSVDGVQLLLEHGPDERPNWRLGDSPQAAANGAEQRARFPTLSDAHARDAQITLRTSSGQLLRIALNESQVNSAGTDAPVMLTATGAYNGTPLKLTGTLQSFARLHDTATPVGTDIHLVSGDTTVDFAGTMTDPLNADGAVGRITLDAPNLDTLLAVAGSGRRVELPIVLAGEVTRQGDLWRLTNGHGTLSLHPFDATAQLREGARQAPDDITLDAGFSVLDLDNLGMADKSRETAIRIDAEPGTLLNAHIAAKELRYGRMRAEDVDLAVKLEPGSFAIEHLALKFAGGDAHLVGSVKNTESSAAVHFDAEVADADASQLSGFLGFGSIRLNGAVDAHASAQLTGNTWTEAVRRSRGALVLSMTSGTIDSRIIELSSTDLRLLFRGSEGTARIACLLGVVGLRDGISRIAPLRIRTSAGTVTGMGTFDIRNETIDVTVASDSASTGFFALDVPVRISGPIGDVNVLPVLGSAGPSATASADLRDIPPEMREFARRNACIAGARR